MTSKYNITKLLKTWRNRVNVSDAVAKQKDASLRELCVLVGRK